MGRAWRMLIWTIKPGLIGIHPQGAGQLVGQARRCSITLAIYISSSHASLRVPLTVHRRSARDEDEGEQEEDEDGVHWMWKNNDQRGGGARRRPRRARSAPPSKERLSRNGYWESDEEGQEATNINEQVRRLTRPKGLWGWKRYIVEGGVDGYTTSRGDVLLLPLCVTRSGRQNVVKLVLP